MSIKNKLMYLWNKRIKEGLNEEEWGFLYQEVILVLSRCGSCYSLISKFPESAENYYDSFFSDVIFKRLEGKDFQLNRPQEKEKVFQLNHPQSLCPLFKNYLLTVNKVAERNWSRYLGDKDKEMDAAVTPNRDKRDAFLLDKGLTKETIAMAAIEFLEMHEEWVSLYLKHHYCADKNNQITMEELAMRYKISSYHYKAKKLGCIQQKKKPETQKSQIDYDAYKKTYLGIWLSKLGIELSLQNRSEIYQIFEILCSEASAY